MSSLFCLSVLYCYVFFCSGFFCFCCCSRRMNAVYESTWLSNDEFKICCASHTIKIQNTKSTHQNKQAVNMLTNKQSRPIKHSERKTIARCPMLLLVLCFNTQIHIFWTLALKRIAFVLAEIRTPFNTNTINVYSP